MGTGASLVLQEAFVGNFCVISLNICHILLYFTSGNSMEGAAVSVVQLLLVQAALGPLDNPL